MTLSFDCSEKTLFLNAGSFSAKTNAIVVDCADARYSLADYPVCQITGETFQAELPDLVVTLTCDSRRALSISLTNTHPAKCIKVNTVSISFSACQFTMPRMAHEHLHWLHSRDFMTASGVKPVHRALEWAAVNTPSSLVTAYAHADSQEGVLLGILPPYSSAYTYFHTIYEDPHAESRFGVRIVSDFDQTLRPNTSISTAPLVALHGQTAADLPVQFGRMASQALKGPLKKTAAGWNSWDYYLGAISRRDVDDNVAACRQTFSDKIQYIVVDEGYECQWGTWQANWKFPQGLADLAESIKKAGYRAGIWTAPLMVHAHNLLFRRHPEWFLKNADGSPHFETLAYGLMAQLDITHPDVREHLSRLFTRLKGEGFAYFKCDFTQLSLNAARCYDDSVGRADRIRHVFQVIREAIGPDAYLLACGAPFESVIGIVDGVRTANDIHTYWTHIFQCARTTFARLWMQHHVANLDPDFLVVRCEQTSKDASQNPASVVKPIELGFHWKDGRTMNIEEAKVWASAVYLTGGDVFLSDNIAALNAMGLSIIDKVLPVLGKPAQWVNMFDYMGHDAPVLIGQTESAVIVAWFNFCDRPITEPLINRTDASIAMTDFWKDQSLSFGPGQHLITLPPRSVCMLRAAPDLCVAYRNQAIQLAHGTSYENCASDHR